MAEGNDRRMTRAQEDRLPPATNLPPTVAVSGFALPPFAALPDVFARAVAAQGEGTVALSIHHDGRHVVDLVGGDYRSGQLHVLFSISKAVAAIAAAVASADGLLDLDAPLADCWPELRRPSTENITLQSVLSHRSGLAVIEAPLTWEELLAGGDDDAIGRQEPCWPTDRQHGYHTFTYGTLVDGTFKRAVGESVAAFIRRRIATPLDIDLWLGVPKAELERVRPMTFRPPQLTPGQAAWIRQSAIPDAAMAVIAHPSILNSAELATASFPALSLVSCATALSRLFAATLGEVDGVRLLSETSLRALTRSRSRGLDRILGVETHFGSGVQLPFPQLPFLGPASFGHEGAGGAAAFADPELGLAVALTTSVFPTMPGAGTAFLSLLPTIRHCTTSA
jgi:CubicO group peptidase (beta-lactamase class C family)